MFAIHPFQLLLLTISLRCLTTRAVAAAMTRHPSTNIALRQAPATGATLLSHQRPSRTRRSHAPGYAAHLRPVYDLTLCSLSMGTSSLLASSSICTLSPPPHTPASAPPSPVTDPKAARGPAPPSPATNELARATTRTPSVRPKRRRSTIIRVALGPRTSTTPLKSLSASPTLGFAAFLRLGTPSLT